MTLISTAALFFYGLYSSLHSYYADSFERVRVWTKPLLMPLLGLFYYLAPGDSPWIYSALLFAWLGDIALLKHSKVFFMLGLVSFLVGHLCMSTHVVGLLSTSLTAAAPVAIFIVILSLALGLFNYLRPHLGSLKLPVLAYCLVLANKGCLALILMWQIPNAYTALVAVGALVFMVSDFTLAINRFVKPIQKAHLWVMSSYTLAQAMMVLGLSQSL